jgi:hypothetical protein
MAARLTGPFGSELGFGNTTLCIDIEVRKIGPNSVVDMDLPRNNIHVST